MTEAVVATTGQTHSRSVEETEAHARRLARVFGRPPFEGLGLILLSGELGSGKTAWARGFAAGLGIRSDVHSPTYTVMNVYRDGNQALYHLDLYRLSCLEEVADIGLFEIIEAGNPCMVEWSERVEALSQMPHLFISLAVQDADERLISWRIQRPPSENIPHKGRPFSAPLGHSPHRGEA